MTSRSISPSVAQLFVSAVERYPDRGFLRRIDGERDDRVSYQAAAARVAAIAERLRGLGLGAGDRLVTWLDEIEASVYLDLACLHHGVVPAPIGASVSLDAALRLAQRVDARAVFTTLDRVPELEARGVRAFAIDPANHHHGDALSVLRAAAARRSPDDLYVLQPTSGTTGELKLVMRQHHTFVRVGPLLAAGLARDAEPPTRILLVAALTHGMGQYLLATGVHLAAELCVTTRPDAASSLEEVRRLDPTYACLTPRVLASYHRQHAELGQDPEARVFGPALRTLVMGGAAPDPALLAHAVRHGIDAIETYGASEISLLAVTERGRWRPGVVGKILPDVTLEIRDDGELLARSGARMVGYYGDEPRTREAFTEDGFYRTGDFCEITPAHELRYVRRKRDVFNTHDGANLYPAVIEDLLERIPWVAQVFLVGDQRPYLVALFVIAGDAAPDDVADGFLEPRTHEALHARARVELGRLNQQLEANQRVQRFALLARSFPADAYAVVGHGKVRRDRAALEARYAARIGELYAPATAERGQLASVADDVADDVR
jgi:long-chain acyl-CoA synthetase